VREQHLDFFAELGAGKADAVAKVTLRHLYLAREVVSLNIDPICEAAEPFIAQRGNNPNTPEASAIAWKGLVGLRIPAWPPSAAVS